MKFLNFLKDNLYWVSLLFPFILVLLFPEYKLLLFTLSVILQVSALTKYDLEECAHLCMYAKLWLLILVVIDSIVFCIQQLDSVNLLAMGFLNFFYDLYLSYAFLFPVYFIVQLNKWIKGESDSFDFIFLLILYNIPFINAAECAYLSEDFSIGSSAHVTTTNIFSIEWNSYLSLFLFLDVIPLFFVDAFQSEYSFVLKVILYVLQFILLLVMAKKYSLSDFRHICILYTFILLLTNVSSIYGLNALDSALSTLYSQGYEVAQLGSGAGIVSLFALVQYYLITGVMLLLLFYVMLINLFNKIYFIRLYRDKFIDMKTMIKWMLLDIIPLYNIKFLYHIPDLNLKQKVSMSLDKNEKIVTGGIQVDEESINLQK
jgi:hypothetical protein